MEMIASDKHSSLLRTFVNYGHKKFYNIGPWFVCIRVSIEFYSNNDIIFKRIIEAFKYEFFLKTSFILEINGRYDLIDKPTVLTLRETFLKCNIFINKPL